jgi:Ca-activated chloride channel family protein
MSTSHISPATPDDQVHVQIDSWTAWLSVLLSLFVHAGLLAVIALYFAFWAPRGVVSSEGDGDYRSVGLYSPADSPDATLDDSQPNEPTERESAVQPATAATEPMPLDDSPPVPLDLPQPLSSVIGPGPAAVNIERPSTSSIVKPATSGTSANSGRKATTKIGGLGSGTATFFGQQAGGCRFVYLLVAWGCMTKHNAIGVAMAELNASLQRLESTQQFQIVFYNSQPFAMRVRGSNDALFWGTDPNRLLAHQFIDSISPDSGTNHIEALRLAMRLGPDVIFLLTDADEPRLTGVELDEVRKRNGGKAQIHATEFGRGADLGPDNFLKKLARQNGGTHSYRDVTRFGRE